MHSGNPAKEAGYEADPMCPSYDIGTPPHFFRATEDIDGVFAFAGPLSVTGVPEEPCLPLTQGICGMVLGTLSGAMFAT